MLHASRKKYIDGYKVEIWIRKLLGKINMTSKPE